MVLVYGLLGLALMVLIHEFGHFIVARMLGVGVERFSIGFGPRLITVKGRKTEYIISLILLGGYVKLKGETQQDGVADKDSFFIQPLWKRFLIVLAGPVFNIVSAVIFLFFAYSIGTTQLAAVVGEVMSNSAAAKMGIKSSDKIVQINNKEIRSWADMAEVIKNNPDKAVVVKVVRNGHIVVLKGRMGHRKGMLGKNDEIGFLGVKPKGVYIHIRYSPAEALIKGINDTVYYAKLTVQGLYWVISGIVPAKDLGGPIMIVKFTGEAAEAGLGAFLALIAVISINLGILNLLPIPVLDGGHLMFYTIEAIIRRPVSLKTQENFQKIGIAILVLLMIFVFANDLRRYKVFETIKTHIERLG
ncbi:RIP metalloprotease RseP [Hippea jasoniae]|uniref:RIP metalloprotease RseP n=1 Tax=Hippea jasoniae TaxID=944479 RepID=UPI0005594937|nr:RIP metalloprotease RseP [Hippea jasoniae]